MNTRIFKEFVCVADDTKSNTTFAKTTTETLINFICLAIDVMDIDFEDFFYEEDMEEINKEIKRKEIEEYFNRKKPKIAS